MKICQKIKEKLKFYSDEKYRKFSATLLPNTDNLIGVRLPILRKLAKEIAKNNCDDFLNAEPEYYEETMLQGMVIGLVCKNIEDLPIIKNFIHKIDNWGVCDSFCCSLKLCNHNLQNFWEFITPYAKSDDEFEQRFAYVMMLNYFVTKEYLSKIFTIVDKFKSEKYYAQMAVAWLLSICYVKFPIETETYLRISKLDKFTYNKSIQKIIESYRVENETKNRLRAMKH